MPYLQIFLADDWIGGGLIMALFIGVVVVCAYLLVCRHREKAPAVTVHFKRIAYKVLKK